MASKGLRVAARCFDLMVELGLVIVTLIVLGDSHRIWTSAFLATASVAGYEALTTRWIGGTFGKRVTGICVIPLDRRRPASLGAATRRGVLQALFTIAPMVAALVGLALLVGEDAFAGLIVLVVDAVIVAWWASSTLDDPLGRGVADRLANTMVVPDRFVGVVTTRDLPGFADGARPPRLIAAGRVADADVRARARLRALERAPVLAAALGLMAVVLSIVGVVTETDGHDERIWFWIGTAIWVVLFAVHEAIVIHRRGANAGHVLAGLKVVSHTDGGLPGRGRAAARAIVLGLTVYVPVLWPFLALSLLMMRTGEKGRGLHDFAGRTVVISDPSFSPESQRQRAMRIRLGRAG